MLLRKINAILSLVITFLLLDHAIFFSVWMLSRGTIEKSADNLPWLMAILMVIHAVLCISFAILAHKGAENRKFKEYPQMNIPTYIQRFTGILLLILFIIHAFPNDAYQFIQPVIYIAALAHVSISTDKAFITLGIGNAKTAKIIGIAAKILCGTILILGLIGFCVYLSMGGVK